MISRRLLFLSIAAVVSAIAVFVTFFRQIPQALPSEAARIQALATVEALTSQIKEHEAIILAISPEDQQTYAAFLQQPHTGIFRLLPRERYDGTVHETKYLLAITGAGAYYSFACQTHKYGYRTDIGLQRGVLESGFYGSDTGLFVVLGDEDLAALSINNPHAQALAQVVSPTLELDERLDILRQMRGKTIDGVSYNDRVPGQIYTTYLLRSIHDDHEASDRLVALRIVRQDQDGSLIILWKELERFPLPADVAKFEAAGCS
jgi:hypothetical protein